MNADEALPVSFTAVLERGGEAANTGYFLRVPPETAGALGAKGQLRVVAAIGGKNFRLSLAPYGGTHWLGLRSEVREACGLSVGDSVTVELTFDREPRVAEVPPELLAVFLEDPAAEAAFKALSYSHQKEWTDHIAEAKRPETRERRARSACIELRAGRNLK